jgi:hypothetical protein
MASSLNDRQAPSDAEPMQKAPVAVHHRSACSGVKALRNTSDARRQAAKLCYRFGPLTPSARPANLIAGDGMKNGFPAPNKELAINQKQLLDTKSPIQVRIRLPPAGSQERTPHRTLHYLRAAGLLAPPDAVAGATHKGFRRQDRDPVRVSARLC